MVRSASVFAVLLLLASLSFAAASSGTTTLQSSTDSACFNFADAKAVPVGDNKDICVEPWKGTPAWCTNFIDMGTADLNSLTIPPTSGYNDDEVGFQDCVEVKSGHAYWIKTRAGKYAAVRVSEAVYVGPSDAGNVNKVTFNWVYFGSGAGSATTPTSSSKPSSNTCIPTSGFILLLGMAGIVSQRAR